MPSLRSTRSAEAKPQKQDPSSDELEEDHENIDEEDEEEAETRCVCGAMDPPDSDGLFIQCEKCSVWQHGFCVNIGDNVPEKYWCEECKPELHTITVTSVGKVSKYLPVQPKRKRRTEEEKEDDKQKRRRERATMNSREDARYEAMIQRALEESKRDAPNDSRSEDERGTRRSRRKKDEADSEPLEDNTPKSEVEEPEEKLESRVQQLKKESENSESNDPTSTKPKKAKRSKRTQPLAKPKEKNHDAIDFNKPTKPRLPQQRTTLHEMRKRVAAILEFIGRTQIDIATEQKDQSELTKFVEDDTMKVNVERMFENYNGSLELMDGLTRKLLLWENRFGKFGEK